jgi:hypothetical protein
MANAVEKVNLVATTSIETINGVNDANLQALNGLEFTGLSTGSWTAGPNLSVGRTRGANIGLARTAMLVVAGNGAAPVAPAQYLNTTEEFDGSSWSSGGNISTGYRQNHAGAGSGTAGLLCSGFVTTDQSNASYVNTTEEYDGSSWSSGGNMNTDLEGHKGWGTQTSCSMFGGYDEDLSSPSYTDNMETYNGSSWSQAEQVLPSSEPSRAYGFAGGTSASAGMYGGGYSTGWSGSGYPYHDDTFTWNGSSWTLVSGGNLSIARNEPQGGGHNTSFVISGGFHPTESGPKTETELWDGSTWSTGGAEGSGTAQFSPGTLANFSGGNVDVGSAGGSNGDNVGNVDFRLYDR